MHITLMLAALVALMGLPSRLPAAEGSIPDIRLSPRPASVALVQDPVFDLAGDMWAGKRGGDGDADFNSVPVTVGKNGWTKITLPGPVAKGHATGRFQRTFTVPADWAGKRIKFRCDAAQGVTEVFVNGVSIGTHDGSWAIFELDASQAVRPGDNLLSIRVEPSPFRTDDQGGIPRKLYLMALPPAHMAGLQVETIFDTAFHDAVLSLRLALANEVAAPAVLTLRWRLQDPDGKDVNLSVTTKDATTVAGNELRNIDVAIPVKTPLTWHPEHPYLYTLVLDLLRDGVPVETVRQRVGFRQVVVKGDQLMVNGTPIKLRGAMMTMWYNQTGWGILNQEQRRNLVDAWVDMNMNSCYPNPTPDEELLELCDEKGLAVIAMARQTWSDAKASNVPHFVRQAADLVAGHRNHPSVLIWTLGNESGWGPAFDAMAASYRQLDPSRPYMLPDTGVRPNAPPSTILPIGSWHYPDAQLRQGPSKRPLIYTEYAHVMAYDEKMLQLDPGVREWWHRELEPLWNAIYATPYAAGGMIFAGTDCVDMTWGLVDGWHRPKPEYWHTRKLYAPVRVISSTAPTSPDGPLRITLENRYDVTDLKDISITWAAGGKNGTVQAAIAPHTIGAIEIPGVSSGPVALTFTEARGRIIDVARVTVGDSTPTPLPPAPVVGRPTLQQQGGITVMVGKTTWRFDAASGLLVDGSIDGVQVVSGGPFLHVGSTLESWQATRVVACQTATGAVSIISEGAAGEYTGTLTMTIDATGGLGIAYNVTYAGKPFRVREVGLAWDLPRAFETLHWNRIGRWPDYPADHIGRPQGSALAMRDKTAPADPFGPIPRAKPPTWPWALDQTAAGTNDFRSGKYDIRTASLRAADGSALVVDGDGSSSVRAAVNGSAIRLLVLDYAGAGHDKFLKAGASQLLIDGKRAISGSATLHLARFSGKAAPAP